MIILYDRKEVVFNMTDAVIAIIIDVCRNRGCER